MIGWKLGNLFSRTRVNNYCPRIYTSQFNSQQMCHKTAGQVAFSEDPNQLPYSVASDLGLQFAQDCLSLYLGLIWYAAELFICNYLKT